MVKGLSTHLGTFCQIDKTAMSWFARQAVSEGRHAYVLANNRSVGNAPLTVQALSEMRHDEVTLRHRSISAPYVRDTVRRVG